MTQIKQPFLIAITGWRK